MTEREEAGRGRAPVTHGAARRVAAALVLLAALLVVGAVVGSGALVWWADTVTGYWSHLPLP